MRCGCHFSKIKGSKPWPSPASSETKFHMDVSCLGLRLVMWSRCLSATRSKHDSKAATCFFKRLYCFALLSRLCCGHLLHLLPSTCLTVGLKANQLFLFTPTTISLKGSLRRIPVVFFFKPEPHVHIYWCVNDSHLAEVLEFVQLIATAGSHDGTSMMKMIHHCSAIPLGNRDSQSFIRLFLSLTGWGRRTEMIPLFSLKVSLWNCARAELLQFSTCLEGGHSLNTWCCGPVSKSSSFISCLFCL